MSKEIIKCKGEETLEIKRFYLPIKIESPCPNCGKNIVVDFENMDYLSYPTLNKPEQVTFYCDECDSEYVMDITLRIEVEIDRNLRKVE